MEKKNKADFLVALEQEENRVANEHYKAKQTTKEMKKLKKDYEGIFARSAQLFSRLEKMFQKSQTKYIFGELFSEIKSEEQDIFERIDKEKTMLTQKKEDLEKRENEIYYEKRRLRKELS
ncbi:DUF3958 family protein [uncultured Enterococcus sp.]|uniref:DUF3958 family protein n=1 Tax=uncultured Enterococcus sp. TaxID=167972 RepID=UPI002AA5FD9A|nr:DUF3958 family protein [uncultured Enterococcus sp.]